VSTFSASGYLDHEGREVPNFGLAMRFEIARIDDEFATDQRDAAHTAQALSWTSEIA